MHLYLRYGCMLWQVGIIAFTGASQNCIQLPPLDLVDFLLSRIVVNVGRKGLPVGGIRSVFTTRHGIRRDVEPTFMLQEGEYQEHRCSAPWCVPFIQPYHCLPRWYLTIIDVQQQESGGARRTSTMPEEMKRFDVLLVERGLIA